MFQSPPASRFTVVLPPENEGWRETVTRLLEPQGVHALTVRTGREVLETLEQTPVHAVVLDTQMPQLGGLQVLRLMRERLPRTPPAILLTQDLNNHLLREALTMRVFSVLAKPVDFNLLLDALARLLKRFHENRWPD